MTVIPAYYRFAPIIPVARRKDLEFKASLGYI
jgi:hypothetical protein